MNDIYIYILKKFIWYKKNLEIKEGISFSNCKNEGLTNVEVNSGGSRTAATFKVQLFVITVNGFEPLTAITKSSTLDVAAVLDPPLKLQNR